MELMPEQMRYGQGIVMGLGYFWFRIVRAEQVSVWQHWACAEVHSPARAPLSTPRVSNRTAVAAALPPPHSDCL